MKAPWVGRTGAAKIAAWSATVLGVSLGLCGANVVGSCGIAQFPDKNALVGVTSSILLWTAYLEVFGMLVGAMGLVVAVVVWVWEVVTIVVNERDSK